ncbi:MAG TPA: hypothetical protein VGD72_13750 [Mycobacteriales bacterium]|jgi:hypothetical protein
MRALHRSITLPAAAALLLLAGCSTGSEAGTTATSSAQPAPTGSVRVESSPAGRALTAAEVRAVVPPLALFPAGWRVDHGGGLPSPADTSATVSPARCQALFDQLHRQRRDAGASVATSAEGDFESPDSSRHVSVAVDSYADTAAEDLFRTAAEALADCPRFRSTAATPAEFRASPLPFPRLGEETLALRFNGTAGSRPFTLDFVAFRVGRTAVTAQQVTFGATVDPQLLERLANAALRQLAPA